MHLTQVQDCILINMGGIHNSYACNTASIYPVIYLKNDIKITSGDGSLDNSYKLAL